MEDGIFLTTIFGESNSGVLEVKGDTLTLDYGDLIAEGNETRFSYTFQVDDSILELSPFSCNDYCGYYSASLQ